MDPLDREFGTVLSYFPEPDAYALGPDEYLEHIRRVKAAVTIPVIASLNGTTAEAWLKFATLIEQAGADAIELNMYEVVTDLDQTALGVENGLKQVVDDLKHALKIPVAVKLSPFFTAPMTIKSTGYGTEDCFDSAHRVFQCRTPGTYSGTVPQQAIGRTSTSAESTERAR